MVCRTRMRHGALEEEGERGRGVEKRRCMRKSGEREKERGRWGSREHNERGKEEVRGGGRGERGRKEGREMEEGGQRERGYEINNMELVKSANSTHS